MKITKQGGYWLAEYRIPGRSAVLMVTGDTIADAMTSIIRMMEKWNAYQTSEEH